MDSPSFVMRGISSSRIPEGNSLVCGCVYVIRKISSRTKPDGAACEDRTHRTPENARKLSSSSASHTSPHTSALSPETLSTAVPSARKKRTPVFFPAFTANEAAMTEEKNGVRPLPKGVMQALNVVINLLRSVPFLILMIMVFPLSRLIVGTTVGTVASIVPLVIASFPFVARLVESSLREVNPNIIEMAQSMGASPLQIIMKVMIPESVPSLLSNFTIAITTILGYSAMSGAIGGGGLGKIAISYGYNRYKYLVMLLAVILLVILVQIFQSAGTRLAVKSDKRLKGR